jgi:hypothetical protein
MGLTLRDNFSFIQGKMTKIVLFYYPFAIGF